MTSSAIGDWSRHRAARRFHGMAADFYPFDMAFLGRAATRVLMVL
jgi:hypothetical protein